MLNSKIMMIYRIIAILILSIPTAINFYSKADVVSSIIYVPLITLGLSAIAIFIDGMLEGLLNKTGDLTKLTAPTADVYLNNGNDIVIYKSFIKPNSLGAKVVQLPSNPILYEVQVT